MGKRLWILLILSMILMGACGCMNSNNTLGRKETDQQYAQLMLTHMEEKYGTTFQIVETIFPEAGINSGMRENVTVLRDSNGVTANVKARLSTPYSYYDDYVDACGAERIQQSLDFSSLQELGNARLYAVVDSRTLADIRTEPAHVTSVTLVVNIPGQVTEEALERLYNAYCSICDAGYRKLYVIAWFTDGAAEFDQAVENYRVYGKASWKNYTATVYASLKVTTPGLSFREFRDTLIEN